MYHFTFFTAKIFSIIQEGVFLQFFCSFLKRKLKRLLPENGNSLLNSK
jgi:hypothetical protein